MVNTGLEHFCSMPAERKPTGGRPTPEVRFNVRLYVAAKVISHLVWSLMEAALLTTHDLLQNTTGTEQNSLAKRR